MNVIACVKQVPDTETLIKVKPDGSGIDETGIKWVMNPYDEFGVEEALKLKEKLGGDVTIVSVGPARALETIRTALAMGADKGIHINDPALERKALDRLPAVGRRVVDQLAVRVSAPGPHGAVSRQGE